jgi:hypothetical protein
MMMLPVMILLGLWFMAAKDETARQNILAIYVLGLILEVVLWTF